MADPIQGEPFQGREPYRQTPPEPRVYSMGDHGPFPGQAPSRPDDDIKRDVDTALFYDDAVSSLGVDVSVQSGVVTMNGAVNSELAKRLAGEDAWKVGGVRDVKNDLQVHESPTPSRAAGQDVVSTKPPDAINGEPPAPATKQGQ
ncbi:MAG: BON domain-containing protein [Chloroflexota bacterium]